MSDLEVQQLKRRIRDLGLDAKEVALELLRDTPVNRRYLVRHKQTGLFRSKWWSKRGKAFTTLAIARNVANRLGGSSVVEIIEVWELQAKTVPVDGSIK